MGDFKCRLGGDVKHLAPKVVGTSGFHRVPTSENDLSVLDFCKALANESGMRGSRGVRYEDIPDTIRLQIRQQ